MEGNGAARLWAEAMEDSYLTALRAWLKKWRGLRTSEDALAQDVVTRHVQAEISHRFGTLKVIVVFTCRPAHHSETYFYAWRRVQENGWLPAKRRNI